MIVSVIIPCFNVENYINECVESVFAQKYTEIEVICIDNNSSDNTWELLKQLKIKFPQLIINIEVIPGAPAARNMGLRLAKGTWIQFLDADDLLLPRKIENQVALVKNKSDLNFVVGDYISRSVEGVDKCIAYKTQNPFLALLNTQLGNTCSNLFKHQFIKNIGGWDLNYHSSQEAKLMFDLLKVNNKVIYDNNAFTIIRERASGQISQGDPNRKWKQYISLRVEIFKYLKNSLPVIFEKNLVKILQILFDHLRVLSKYDILLANRFYNEIFSKDFAPRNINGNITIYSRIFKILGFSKTEKLFRLLNEKKKNK